MGIFLYSKYTAFKNFSMFWIWINYPLRIYFIVQKNFFFSKFSNKFWFIWYFLNANLRKYFIDWIHFKWKFKNNMNLNWIDARHFISIVALQNKKILLFNNLPFKNACGQRIKKNHALSTKQHIYKYWNVRATDTMILCFI